MNGQPSPGGSFDVHKHEEVLTSAPPLLGDSLKYKRRMLTGKHYIPSASQGKKIHSDPSSGYLYEALARVAGAVLVFPTEDIVSKCVTQCNPLEQHDAA